jgi:predicted XRE-type DNA-binding protein
LEIVASYQGKAWRAVYTVRFRDAIEVLHAFQKKSKKGIATPAREIDRIRKRASRRREGLQTEGSSMKTKARKARKRTAHVIEGTGNAFADVGLPSPEQDRVKAQLILQIHTILKGSGMTQTELAKILGVQQPQVSLLMRNRAGNFSVGRLMEFLTALRRDVQITVKPSRKEHGELSVISA